MRSPEPSTVVIACPHCGTRYQVPPETLGADGPQGAVRALRQGLAGRGRRTAAAARRRPAVRRPTRKRRSTASSTPSEQRAASPKSPRRCAARCRTAAAAEVRALDRRDQGGDRAQAAAEPPVAPSRRRRRSRRRPTASSRSGSARWRGKLPAARLRRVIRIAAVLLLLRLIAGGLMLPHRDRPAGSRSRRASTRRSGSG